MGAYLNRRIRNNVTKVEAIVHFLSLRNYVYVDGKGWCTHINSHYEEVLNKDIMADFISTMGRRNNLTHKDLIQGAKDLGLTKRWFY